ncbi:MAG: GIY-YIG nuclease family protein [Akkermansiaceae bacterium]|nr:GIY-YIG nuclease family protein [Akkermansiaceae bacterium]
MAQRKTITLFLMDGTMAGRIRCDISGWTGVLYKIPRKMLDNYKELDDMKNHLEQSGLYLLFGMDDHCYVGQAIVRKSGGGLICRVREPHNEIDDWTEAVMLTTNNNSFGPTELCYLENRFYNLAQKAGYQVRNKNEPNLGHISEAQESVLDEVICNTEMWMDMLGYRFSERRVSPPPDKEQDGLLHMKYKKACAWGRPLTSGEFVILQGSTINPETTQSCPEMVLKSRKEHADKISETNELTEDISMSSTDAAAKFIAGASISGNKYWLDEQGRSLKESKG